MAESEGFTKQPPRYWIVMCGKCNRCESPNRYSGPCSLCGAGLPEYSPVRCSCGSLLMSAGRDRAQCPDCRKWNSIPAESESVVRTPDKNLAIQ
jgi:phage FluMu protein Com